MKILHVVGARPNFMKAAPIMREMAKYPQEFEQLLVHTGQHYDPVLRPVLSRPGQCPRRMCDNMSKVFFEELELPQPDIYLGVGSGSHVQQTARIMLAFEPMQEEANERTSSCNEKGRGSTSATLEGRNRYR